jgi:hypothetical protein
LQTPLRGHSVWKWDYCQRAERPCRNLSTCGPVGKWIRKRGLLDKGSIQQSHGYLLVWIRPST